MKKFASLYDDGTLNPCEILDNISLGNVRDHDYNIIKLINESSNQTFRKQEIINKKCNCDWNCASSHNMLYDPKTYPRIAKAVITPTP